MTKIVIICFIAYEHYFQKLRDHSYMPLGQIFPSVIPHKHHQ